MGIFRQFPYSNFHDLNLDWLLSKMRELGINVDEFEEKLSTDFENLSNNFDELEKLVNDFVLSIDDELRDDILAQVDKWLDDHPEATTTVQDNSLTVKKFVKDLQFKITAPSMYYFENISRLPYRRNAEASMQGGVCTSNNIFYQYSDANNEVLKFNVESGLEINNNTIELGHCNSMSFIEAENLLIAYGTFGNNNLPYNRITLIDGDTLNVVNQIDLPIPDLPDIGNVPINTYGYMCAFDNDNNKLYIGGQAFLGHSSPSYIIEYDYNDRSFTYTGKYNVIPKVLSTGASDMTCYDGNIYILTSEQPQIVVYSIDEGIIASVPVSRKISSLTYAAEFESISIIDNNIIISYRASCFRNMFGGGSYVYAKSSLTASTIAASITTPEFQQSITLHVDNANNDAHRDGSSTNPFNNIYEAMNCAYNFSAVTIYDHSKTADEMVIAVEFNQNIIVNAVDSVINYGVRMDGGSARLINIGFAQTIVNNIGYYLYIENNAKCVLSPWGKPDAGIANFEAGTVAVKSGSELTYTNMIISNIDALNIERDSHVEQQTQFAGTVEGLIRTAATGLNTKNLKGFRGTINGSPHNYYIPVQCNVLVVLRYNNITSFFSLPVLGTQFTIFLGDVRCNFALARDQEWAKVTAGLPTGVTVTQFDVWV